MTFKQRYILEHSVDAFDKMYYNACPFMYGYCDKSDCLDSKGNCRHNSQCTSCWNRDNFDDCGEEKETKETTNMNYSHMKKAELIEQINTLNAELQTLEKYKKYEGYAAEAKAMFDAFEACGFTHEEVFRLLELTTKTAR